MHQTSFTPMTCPEHSLLLALVEGRLPDREADTVSLHVADCNNCDARMEQIEDESDPLVHALSSFPATDDDELVFQRLQAELLSQPEPFVGTTGLTTSATEGYPEDASYTLQQALPFQLGNYELLEQIGAGAHGAVFRAQHRRLEREVAVKLLLRARGPFVDEFLNEMRVVGKLDHPNIIRATDAGEHDGIYFLVMEFVPGLDVSSLLLRTGPLRVADACEIIRQTALGLAFAHQHDLVHRDVKTSNLLFSSNGNVKLLDLGLATIPSQSQSSSDKQHDGEDAKSSHRHPEAPHQLSGPRGTADYMAPEQWKEASSVTHKADLYSLGCTFYKLLTGQPPFRATSAKNKHTAHESNDVPPLANFRKDVPAAVEALVLKLLSKSADDRPDSALHVADAVAEHAIGARLTRIARLHCPEHKSTQPASPTSAPRDTLWRRIKRFPNKISRRTQIIGTVSLVAAATFFLATRPSNQSSHIDVSSWRSLTSSPTIVKLSTSDPKPLLKRDDSQFEFESTGTSLIHLGNPMVKTYRWRTQIEHFANEGDDSSQFGIFFRLQKNKQDEFSFQTIEFLRGGGMTRVLWCDYQEPNQMVEPIVLAETIADIPQDAVCDLTIVVGRSGFPEISINGKSRLESEWVLSAEARDFVAGNRDELAKVYAGRIGVFHWTGRTKIHSSQLSYLDR